MKRLCLLLLPFLFSTILTAQTGYDTPQQHYAIKTKALGGAMFRYNNYKNIAPSIPTVGLEVDIEFLPSGKYAWEQRWGFPTFGVGVLGMGMPGNYQQTGATFAVYPYMLWTVARSRYFDFGIKTGLGIAFMTKGGYGFDGDGNATCIRGYAGGFANVALEGKIKVSELGALTIEGGGQWINNGEVLLPNFTANIFYGSIGYQHRLSSGTYRFPRKRYRSEHLKEEIIVNIMLAGGGLSSKYTGKTICPTGTFHTDVQFKVNNVYTTGVGLDAFYNGVYKYRFNPNENRDAEFAKRMRAGMAWNNSFYIGRITLLADMGFYLYDPVKDNYGHKGKPFYGYNPSEEDGWLYLRAGVRCRIYDNLFAQASIKTHLLRIDYMEFGLGYSIPLRKNPHVDNKKAKIRQWEIIHPDKNNGHKH